MRARLLEVARGGDPTKPDRMPTVAEWCTQWVEDVIRPRRSPNTYRAYNTRIRCGITPAIGNVRLDRVRPSHARLLERKETEHNSDATARLAQTVLTLALDDAVREGIIDRNPLDGLEPPALEPRETLVLTPDQARRLIGADPPRHRRQEHAPRLRDPPRRRHRMAGPPNETRLRVLFAGYARMTASAA